MSKKTLKIELDVTLLDSVELAVVLNALGDPDPDNEELDALYEQLSEELDRRVGEGSLYYDAARLGVEHAKSQLKSWKKDERLFKKFLTEIGVGEEVLW